LEETFISLKRLLAQVKGKVYRVNKKSAGILGGIVLVSFALFGLGMYLHINGIVKFAL
jgi:hypothetical protein